MSKRNLFYIFIGAIIVVVLGFIAGNIIHNKPAGEPIEFSVAPPVYNKPIEPSAVSVPRTGLYSDEVIFGFEKDASNWEIPDWCFKDDSYKGVNVSVSETFAKEGISSLALMCDFSGEKWATAYVEVQKYFDWTAYKAVSIDMFLPSEAPVGLKAKMILTIGRDWTWTEMINSISLVPGKWTTITASIVPGSIDWRGAKILDEFRADVRKLGVRIESNKAAYSSPVYIDNVRLEVK